MPDKSGSGKPAPSSARIPLRLAVSMIFSYARSRISEQLRAVAFLVIFLAAFQLLVLRRPLPNAAGVALGIGGVIVGLSLFLEGLFLGVMPLGQRCGLHVPARTGKAGILVFSVIVGAAATIAEPAIVFLRAQGGGIEPWQAPLLYLLLNRGTAWLVASIAGGVGIAVAYGSFRFLKGWSLKPFIFIVMPLLLLVSFFASNDIRMETALGLAWDTGGVTTGPVTVPLIIALGVGVSRFSGRGNDEFGGLGVVTAASAIPVLAVLALMFSLAPRVPDPSGAAGFFSEKNREKAVFVAGSEEKLRQLALESLPAELFNIVFPDSAEKNESVLPDGAAPADAHQGGKNELSADNYLPAHGKPSRPVFSYLVDAIKSLVPLTLVLFIILKILKPGRQDGTDEIILGLFFAVAGMFLFSLGMEKGLDVLGRQAGRSLPAAYTVTQQTEETKIFTGIDESMIVRGASSEGITEYLIVTESGSPEFYNFDRNRYNAGEGTYIHIPVQRPILSYAPLWIGFAAVLAFVFALGFGATLAEPSLSALGSTVEELSTGTYRQAFLVKTVAVGVGTGMAAGFARILFDLPLVWMIGIPYAAALLLTLVSSEEFVSVAWDSAGVTTGPVTVPLVLAAGLGVGEVSGTAGSFGVVALASVYPVITVLLTGLVLNRKKSRMQSETGKRV